ncbi:DegV family protein [Vagococcus sp.]|uniref:DegV family protein n=1 Tax=Vagococcus sp. TaxID=1933889 RepID=UPI003F983F77
MTTIKIVTDSSCLIESDRAKDLDIHVIDLSVLINGTVYDDREDLDHEEFMKMMAASKELPKTSQPPLGKFVELYDQLGADGSQIISIHLTEKLSGTVNTARQAVEMTDSDVTVIDSHFIDQALGFQVYEAVKAVKAGATKEEVIKVIEKTRANTSLFIGVATLENLVKGGRIGKLVGALSGFLNMKILMELKNGEFKIDAKGRGNKTFTKWLSSLEDKLREVEVNYLGISEADSLELSSGLKASLHETLPYLKSIPILHTSPLVATHAGKGAFAVMYYTN